MANTTMVENTKGIATATIFFTGCCITIFANVVMIALILWKRQLWHVRFYIISNLAVSDIIDVSQYSCKKNLSRLPYSP